MADRSTPGTGKYGGSGRKPPPPDKDGNRPWPKGDGDNAFGYPVSTERQVAALDTAVDIFGCDPMVADPVITRAARYIASDEIDNALWTLECIADLTGAYRLLAVMCTA